MAKLPYQIRIEQDLLKDIKDKAILERRSVNNMIEVLIANGLKYQVINSKKDERITAPEI